MSQNQQKVELPDFRDFFRGLKNYILDVIDLDKGVDKVATIQEIKDKKSMDGANAWMLMCSIVIASIGLSQNSQAVIIGAMLISPLMSPILGIGLGVGINDYGTLLKSLRHLGLAIAITLITSTIYFAITPFDDLTNEIKARTEPTFLDIFIAIFGGIAGIVSIARKDISTTLPGVAIATALMPPLCVTGYGIAHLDWQITLTSFYLFFLNTFFVAASTYLIIKLLRFPLRKYINPEDSSRNLTYVTFFSLAAIIPSILIFRNVMDDVRFKNSMDTFVAEYIGEEKSKYLDDYERIEGDSSNILYLKVFGNKINNSDIPRLEQGLKNLKIKNTQVQIITSSEVDLSDISVLEDKLLSLEEITQRLEESKKLRVEQEQLMAQMAIRSQAELVDSALFSQVSQEILALFPDLDHFGLSAMKNTDFQSDQTELSIALIEWKEGVKRNQATEDEAKLSSFIQERLELDTLVVVSRR